MKIQSLMKVSEGMVKQKEVRSLSVLGTSSEWMRLIEMGDIPMTYIILHPVGYN